MAHRLAVATSALALGFFGSAKAQTTADAPPEAVRASSWLPGSIHFSGVMDGYYSANLNHPSSRTNQLRNFDVNADQFSLNMTKVTAELPPAPVGFRLDMGFGEAFDLFNGGESSSVLMRYVMQAYVSFKPAAWKGVQIDFGKHATLAGAEPSETYLNWNYSRSLLYANGPYYHFGLRSTFPVHPNISTGFSLVNGWNNIKDNNSGKTVGLHGNFKTAKISWSHSYYTGPEQDGSLANRRHFYDTVVNVTPHGRVGCYLNFNYGTERTAGAGSNDWIGIAGAARFAANDRIAFSPRMEWYKDKDGAITGLAQELKEFTITAEWTFKPGFITRFEFRRDWSDRPFFQRGQAPAAFEHQDTLLIGLIAFFGPRRLE